MDARLFATTSPQQDAIEKARQRLNVITDAKKLVAEMKALGKRYILNHSNQMGHHNQSKAITLRDYDPSSTVSPFDHWRALQNIYAQFTQPGELSRGIDDLWLRYFDLDNKFVDNLAFPSLVKARHAFFNTVLHAAENLWLMSEKCRQLEHQLLLQPSTGESPSV